MGLPFSGRFFVFKNRQIFLLPSVWFVSSLSFWKRNADLIPKTRKTVLSKQVFVPKRGKKKYQHSLYPVNHLNLRKSPSATLVSQEIETDFSRPRFSKSREKSPKGRGRSWSSRRLGEFVRVGGMANLASRNSNKLVEQINCIKKRLEEF